MPQNYLPSLDMIAKQYVTVLAKVYLLEKYINTTFNTYFGEVNHMYVMTQYATWPCCPFHRWSTGFKTG